MWVPGEAPAQLPSSPSCTVAGLPSAAAEQRKERPCTTATPPPQTPETPDGRLQCCEDGGVPTLSKRLRMSLFASLGGGEDATTPLSAQSRK